MAERPQISQELSVASVIGVREAIEAQARANGINPGLAKDIAFCESTHRQYGDNGEVLRGKANRQDVGLFQINEKYHLKTSQELGYDIYTPEGNIGYAMWLLKKEGNRHWNASRTCWQA